MTKRPNKQNLARKYPIKKGQNFSKAHRPFWLPASNFYILAAAISAVIFFLVWGVLHESGEELPWIWAGISGSSILAAAVVLREIILRKRRNRLLLSQGRIDYNLKSIQRQPKNARAENKLTLEKNTIILKEIFRKSEAAKILGKLSEGHREVFELCNEYLERSKRELETIGIGSPRLATLRRSRGKIKNLHKFHLLAWSFVESRALIQAAKNCATIIRKLETAAEALNVLDLAIRFYPDEKQLVESKNAVEEFIVTIKVAHWIEEAERFAFQRNYNKAIDSYYDALFYLEREKTQSSERKFIAETINSEIEKIRKILGEKK